MMRARKRKSVDTYQPSPLEVIKTLLEPKIEDKPVEHEGVFIFQHDDFYATSPESFNWNPIPGLRDHERYYFVRRKALSKNKKGRNVDRTVETGEGFWKKSRKYKIEEGAENTIGSYDLLNFCKYKDGNKTGENSDTTDFLMHEFTLPHSQPEDWVVCHVYYKVTKKAVQRRQQPPAMAMALLAPPYDLMIEDDVSPETLFLPTPHPTTTNMEIDEFTWILNEIDRQEKEDALALEHQEEAMSVVSQRQDSDMEIDEFTCILNEIDRQEKEDALVVEALEHQEEAQHEYDEAQQQQEAMSVVLRFDSDMEIDEFTCILNEIDRQEKEDALVVEALEHQEEAQPEYDEAQQQEEEHHQQQGDDDDDDDDSDDDDWLVEAMDPPDSDTEPDATTSMMDTEQQEEETSNMLSGFEQFRRAPPPMPPRHVFESRPVWLRNHWFNVS